MINILIENATNLINEAFTNLFKRNKPNDISKDDEEVISNFAMLIILTGGDLDEEYDLFDTHMKNYEKGEYIPSHEASYLIKTLYDVWRIWGSAYEIRRGKYGLNIDYNLLCNYHSEYKPIDEDYIEDDNDIN